MPRMDPRRDTWDSLASHRAQAPHVSKFGEWGLCALLRKFRDVTSLHRLRRTGRSGVPAGCESMTGAEGGPTGESFWLWLPGRSEYVTQIMNRSTKFGKGLDVSASLRRALPNRLVGRSSHRGIIKERFASHISANQATPPFSNFKSRDQST